METGSEPSNQIDQKSSDKVSFTIEGDPEIAALLEKLKVEYAASSKGRVIEMLLRDLMAPEE